MESIFQGIPWNFVSFNSYGLITGGVSKSMLVNSVNREIENK